MDTSVLDVAVAPITHDLILGKLWLFEHNLHINWIDHSICFCQETCPTESVTLNSVTLSPRATPMSAKSFSRMITKDRSPCDILMINLPRSTVDECVDCANANFVMTFPEDFPWRFRKRYPSPSGQPLH
jgi:hypothetical protein